MIILSLCSLTLSMEMTTTNACRGGSRRGGHGGPPRLVYMTSCCPGPRTIICTHTLSRMPIETPTQEKRSTLCGEFWCVYFLVLFRVCAKLLNSERTITCSNVSKADYIAGNSVEQLILRRLFYIILHNYSKSWMSLLIQVYYYRCRCQVLHTWLCCAICLACLA